MGPVPTFEQAAATGIERSLIDPIYAPRMDLPESIQASLGMQRQLGERMSISADYVYQHGKNEGGVGVFNRNINLSYDPATGVNYPFTDVSRRPYPDWGAVIMESRHTESYFHGLEMAFTKRFSDRWQASATYLVSRLKDREPPAQGGLEVVSFPTPDDLGGAYSLAVSGQRHRAVFNGIREMGYGFQLSGLYSCGSGQRFARTFGGDVRQMGQGSTNRLRRDGTIVPRNGLVGLPLHRVDIAAEEIVPARTARRARRVCRGVQPVQPRELRQLRDQRGEPGIRTTDREYQRRASAAHGPGRVPLHVLRPLTTSSLRGHIMRVLSFVTGIILLGSWPSFGQEWKEFVSKQDFFSISFQGEPTVRDITYESEYRITLPARVYTHQNGQSRYSVTVVNYKDSNKLHEERRKKCIADGGDGDQCQDDAAEELRGALVFASWNFMKREGAKLTHYAHFNSDRVEGHEVHLTNADGSRTFGAVHMHEDRLYIIEASVPKGAPAPGLFQISVRFLDNEYRPVRYEWVGSQLYINGYPPPPRTGGGRGRGQGPGAQGQGQAPQGQGQGQQGR